MARKKSRQSRSAAKTQTAIAPQSAVAGVSTAPRPAAATVPAARLDKIQRIERSWIEVVVSRSAHLLGSLQMAVVLLNIFAVALILGTMMESWYSAKVAGDLIYRTWWFGLLLIFLGVNIFCAAAKKAQFRGEADIGRDIAGTGYWATLAYWWPWIVVASVFAYTLAVEAFSWWGALLATAGFAFAMSLGLWRLQRSVPVERWWPWKRYQTGFLITHVGLLTMVAGGILNLVAGTDAMLVLIDSARPEVQESTGVRQTNDRMFTRELSYITVSRPGRGKEKPLSQAFEPGPFTWRADQYSQAKLDPMLHVLSWLAHPLPRSWSMDLGGDGQLEVLAYYPNARQEQFRPAEPKDGDAYPAVKFTLSSPMAGNMPERWVASNIHDASVDLGPGMIELLGLVTPTTLPEFSNPPPESALGRRGQLVLFLNGQTYRFSVDDALADKEGQRLEGTKWKVRINDYYANPANKKDKDLTPTYPTVEFELRHDDGRTAKYGYLARRTGLPAERKGSDPSAARNLEGLSVWYHPPDYRYGKKDVRGLLQFAATEDGTLYYRSFNTSTTGKFAFEKAGPAPKGSDKQEVWAGMNWHFRVAEFLPRAVRGTRYVPVDVRPGLEREDVPPAIRCKLTTGRASEEFWLALGTTTTRKVGGQDFEVRYDVKTEDIGFELMLQRAEQHVDPGTQQPASYTSYVRLTDKEKGLQDAEYVITMNQPLNHRGYKFFQSGYAFLDFDAANKPVSRSVFTVSRDPGLWLKYAGSSMLALGIVCMFYMKAYFFKSRGRPGLETAAAGGNNEEALS